MPTLIARLKETSYTPLNEIIGKGCLVAVERGKSYKLNVKSPSACSALFKVDDYIVKDGARCDYMVLVDDYEQHIQILVELKGHDVIHALKQLEASLKVKVLEHKSINRRCARIVAQTIPKSGSNKNVERAKKHFVKHYNCDLRLKSSCMEENI